MLEFMLMLQFCQATCHSKPMIVIYYYFDDDLNGDAQESDDSSDSSDCSNISDSESLSSDD